MNSTNSKTRKLGAASGVFGIVIVVAILTVINLIALKHDFHKDVTSNHRFTLAEQTLQLLENINSPVKALSFVRETDEAYEITQDLLMQYQSASDQFTFRNVDLNREPTLAEKYSITDYQTIVLIQDDAFRKVNEFTEHAFTNTLIRLTRREEQKTIYLTRGNGELDLESLENDGLNFLKMTLNDANYITQSLNLLSTQKIPEDCDILAIISPETDPPAEKIAMITDYLNQGGRLLIALEPGGGTQFKQMLEIANVQVDENVVIDPAGYQNIFQPIIENWEPHEITADFEFGLVLHIASTVTPIQNPDTAWTAKALGKTSENAWLVDDFDSLTEQIPEFDPDSHRKGSFPFAVVTEQIVAPDIDAKPGRIIAMGDADFLSNVFFQTFAAHEPFVMNAIHWLADEKDLIAIPPKQTLTQLLLLQPGQEIIAFVIPIVIIPLIIALIGTVRIFSRRRRA